MNKKKLIFTLFYFLLGGVLTANANITIYVNSSSSSYYMYAWNDDGTLTATWPGTQFSSMSTTTVDGVTYYYMTFDAESVNVIFDTGSTNSGENNQQTSNITGITEDTYFNYSGGTTYTTVSSGSDDSEDTSNTTESFTIYVNSSSSDYYLYAWYGSEYFTGTWPGVQFSSMGTTTVSGTTYYYYTFYGFSSVNLIFDTGNNGSQTGTITVTEDTYFTYSGGTTYETVDISSTSSSTGTTYYLVANAGAKCKFTPDRTRDGGSLNYNYQNLHLQDFIISADGNNFLTGDYLQFHIEDADGTKYYFTSTSDNVLESTSSTDYTDDSLPFNGPITSDGYFDKSYSDAAKLYWVSMANDDSYTSDFKIKAGVGKSYTFLWQPNKSGLYLIVNGEEFGDASSYYTDGTRTSAANYYLIGNFTGASATTDIDPYYSDNRKKLTPYYYSGGDEYGGTMESCDSIVYEIEVARPSAGWSELYLDLVNEEDFNTYSSSSWYGDENAWAKVIRPEATWSSSGAAYALDATALTGGLMRNENASYQSLNPVVSDDIDSYVFTMNASTSTYSIRFVSAASNTTTDDSSTGNDDDDDDDEEEETEETSSYLYIFGTAVGSDGSSTSENWEGAYAFKLTYSSDGYYYYAGSDGKETAIPMTAAGEFAFVTDMDFSKGYYTEDGNRPPTLIEETTEDGTTTYTSTETTAYSANTGGGFYETQYVNMLGTNHTADAAAYSDDLRTITWGLPSGDYYIRFYVGATIGEYAKNLYTVRRSYTLLRPDADAVTVDNNNYTTFKVFCDYNAVVVPSDVDVLYVPEITSVLTENTDDESSDYTTYDLELKVLDFGDNARVLPANTPVILAMTTKRSSNSDDSDDTGDLESSTITMDYYSDPTSTLNSTTTAMTPSIPYEAAPEKTADDGKSYNFFFGYKKLSDDDKKPTIGFYLPISGGYSAINGAYLNLSSEYLGGSEESEESAKEAVLVFYSDLTDIDEADGSETTGISNALAADDADADGAYYTLQGIRIAKPTVKGIYIHNGKKTVVR